MQYTELSELLLRYAGWAFIPQYLTTASIPLFYNFVLRRPPPQRGTIRYANSFRKAYATVIMSYLAYSLVQAARSQLPNYYQLLEVGFDADESQLKTAFRTFAKRSHPDKVGERGMQLFMKVRDAYEALKNPTKRFAYDRFGPASFDFERVITEDEYMHAGLMQCVGFYVATLFFMIAYGVLGEPDSGAIWRYLLFFYLVFCELGLYLQPTPFASSALDGMFPVKSAMAAFPLPVTVIRYIFPHWLPYQVVGFLREVYVTVSIAITRVLPVVWPDEAEMAKNQAWEPVVQRLALLIGKADSDVDRMLATQLVAIQGNKAPGTPTHFPDLETMSVLRKELEDYYVDGTLAQHPMLASMMRDAIIRERQKADNGGSSPPVSPTETLPPTSPRHSPQSSPRHARGVSLPPSSLPTPNGIDTSAARPQDNHLRKRRSREKSVAL